ncbi:MAG TPA: hypothetical protein VGH37_08605 [Candidatus Acidoferrum sp.]|jgi:hypothetical protein
MNCKACQENMFDAVAAGATTLSDEPSAHQQSCPACREYYELQVDLVRSIDSGLQAMVNQEMPASLLAVARNRLTQQPIVQPSWNYLGTFAVLAAVTILAISIGYIRRPNVYPNSGGSASVYSGDKGNQAPGLQLPPKSVIDSRPRTGKRTGFLSLQPVSSEATAGGSHQVIVLVEEQRAFAKFVADLPREPKIAQALTRPAPVALDAPVDIALLRIEHMELKPLESTQGE